MPKDNEAISKPGANKESDPDCRQIIAPTPTLNEYAGLMLKQRLTRLLSHCEGVREGLSTGPVHQMRVWSRRARAALELFQTCYEGSAVTVMVREIKRAADALGEARDMDVMIETLNEMGNSLPENQRAGVLSFASELVVQRAALQLAVDRAVERLQNHDLGAMLDRIIMQPIPVPTSVIELAGSAA